MKAITFRGRQQVRYETVPDPKILKGSDVLIQVEYAAICGSDLHPYHEREKGLDHGTPMGHEAIGRIVEVGSEVRRLKKGDRVFGPFTTNCGTCFFCTSGLTCRCPSGELYGWVEKGKGLAGLQAELARIPLAEATLKVLPKEMSPEAGLLLGDILSTGYFCADMAGITPKGTYAILGCGPVGLMGVLAARELGAEKLFALDSVPERLAIAQAWGATPLNINDPDLRAKVKESTDGRGFDAVMELVGISPAERLGFELLRPGGTLSIVGAHSADHFTFSPPEAYGKNLTLKVGRCPARYYMDKLVPYAQKHEAKLLKLFSHRMKLSDGVRAYEIFDKKLENCTKVLLET